MQKRLGCGNISLGSCSRLHQGVGFSALPTAARAVQVKTGL